MSLNQRVAFAVAEQLPKDGTATFPKSPKNPPTLAVIPVATGAITFASPSQLSVQCEVAMASGSANLNSLDGDSTA
jgi:hypothetical protein